VNFFSHSVTDKSFLSSNLGTLMILITVLICAIHFQPDEPANGRFKLNQWQYLYHYKTSQTTSEPSSIRDGPVNFCREEVVLVTDFPLRQNDKSRDDFVQALSLHGTVSAVALSLFQ